MNVPTVIRYFSGFFVGLSALGQAAGSGSFLKPGQVSATEAERSLLSELGSNVSMARLTALEDMLRPTYLSLPKSENGHLSHQTVRYVLHRMFVHKYSWFVRGLEPTDDAPPPYMQGEWVPSYLQGLLEQRFGSHGIDLPELAALAATMEDLAFREASVWLGIVYGLLNINLSDRIGLDKVHKVVSVYMMVYLRGGTYNALVASEVEPEMIYFASQYTDWPIVLDFMKQIEAPFVNASEDGTLSFKDVTRVVDEVAKQFGSLNDRECHALKASLMNIEDSKQGRVKLSDFYRKGLHSHWEFNEKMSYLRTLGALDESTPSRPRVIIPNYMSSRTNCLQSSSLYIVCCRNECEDLMGHLEREIATPLAEPERILELVSALASDTIPAPRTLNQTMVTRLNTIALGHGGQVPLHGRLFAQWMHHAYPRECPYPHESGTTSPMTPDEWISETGEENSKATEDEMREHIANQTCSLEGPCLGGSLIADDGSDLPWSDVEELLHVHPPKQSVFSKLLVAWEDVPVLRLGLVGLVALPFMRRSRDSQEAQEMDAAKLDQLSV